MICFVYRLYQLGIRLDAEVILQEPPKHGWLAYARPHPWGTPGEHAHLFCLADREKQELPSLQHARLKRVEGGMLFTGGEDRKRYTPQSWLAATTAEELSSLVLALRHKNEVKQAMLEARQRAERAAREAMKEAK